MQEIITSCTFYSSFRIRALTSARLMPVSRAMRERSSYSALWVSATPDFATLLAPASTNLAITGATGTFTVSPPASLPSTLFYRISAKQE